MSRKPDIGDFVEIRANGIVWSNRVHSIQGENYIFNEGSAKKPDFKPVKLLHDSLEKITKTTCKQHTLFIYGS
jgi:hypothetical protein